MLAECVTLFYRKIEEYTDFNYPDGSKHWYLHHFRNAMRVGGQKLLSADIYENENLKERAF